ncbi:MAG: helix-turn-helix transcriptional regulator [Verrucomicrobiia bacterium]|jgi:DNA-binding XRE family transcriptional regulator
MRNKFSSRLRARRLSAGLKQVELAAVAGLGLATVNKLELYPFLPSPLTAGKLAKALDCDISDIYPELSETPGRAIR